MAFVVVYQEPELVLATARRFGSFEGALTAAGKLELSRRPGVLTEQQWREVKPCP